jgi:nicotinate-nucleotide adenylyltransferase
MSSRRVAIMGGAFDPIHNAHLLDAEEARVAFDLDEVVFIPNRVPPIPKHEVLPGSVRLAMVDLAIMGNPAFSSSDMELERSGPSYSFDTVTALKRTRPEIGTLYFITGADALASIALWHRYEELLAVCEFIAVTRPGYDLASLPTEIPEAIRGRVNLLPIPSLEISSTMIRDRVRAGKSIRYLVPDSVARYVEENGLYRAAEGAK